MTAATYGVRAAAFSLDVSDAADAEHWRPASDVVGEILPTLRDLPSGIVLNVNVPVAPRGRIQGIRQARLADAGAVELSIVEAAVGYLHVTMAETGKQPPRDRLGPACGRLRHRDSAPPGLRGDLGRPAMARRVAEGKPVWGRPLLAVPEMTREALGAGRHACRQPSRRRPHGGT